MLRVPDKSRGPKIDVISSKVPTPDEVVIVPQPIMKAASILASRLYPSIRAKWAVGGSAGEIMQGVNVKADHIEILTTKEGTQEIWDEMKEYQVLGPAVVEKKLPREADIGGEMLPVFVKSNYAELTVGGVRVEVYGDEQIKVGDWDWGDPLDFTPGIMYLSGGRLPLVPLSLQSELTLGLGWLDIVQLISDAVFQKHEHLAGRRAG